MAFSMKPPGVDEEMSPKSFRQLRSWLYQLNEYLRYAFSHIGADALTQTLSDTITGKAEAETVARLDDAVTGAQTQITVNEGAMTGVFRAIGADGYSAAGVVRAGADGITVEHEDVNARTVMAADGFRLYRVTTTGGAESARLIGGLYQPDGAADANLVAGVLCDPDVNGLSHIRIGGFIEPITQTQTYGLRFVEAVNHAQSEGCYIGNGEKKMLLYSPEKIFLAYDNESGDGVMRYLTADQIVTAKGRLAPKMAFGSCSPSGTAYASISFAGAGFTGAPRVIAGYATTGVNSASLVSNGVPGVYAVTASGAKVIMSGGGSDPSLIEWIAVGV